MSTGRSSASVHRHLLAGAVPAPPRSPARGRGLEGRPIRSTRAPAGAGTIGEVTGSLNIILWAGHIVTTALHASAFGRYASTMPVSSISAMASAIFIAVFPW